MITSTVRHHFFRIVKMWLRGIVSQARHGPAILDQPNSVEACVGLLRYVLLKYTKNDNKGNTFGLGQISKTVGKGKQKQNKVSFTPTEMDDVKDQLSTALAKISDIEKMMKYMKTTDPRFATLIY